MGRIVVLIASLIGFFISLIIIFLKFKESKPDNKPEAKAILGKRIFIWGVIFLLINTINPVVNYIDNYFYPPATQQDVNESEERIIKHITLVVEKAQKQDLEKLVASEQQEEKGIKESGLVNVALNKPVTLVGSEVLIGGKPYDHISTNIAYSINMGLYPSNLTDGKRNTMAYPASWVFDYVIDLMDVHEIKKVNLVWAKYGKEKGYITEWKLYSQKKLQSGEKPSPDSITKAHTSNELPEFRDNWEVVTCGKFPGSEVTTIDFKKSISVRRFRIAAVSINNGKSMFLNWIGIGQFEAYVEKIVNEQS